MFAAAFGTAPLAIAGKALGTMATLAAEARRADFQGTFEQAANAAERMSDLVAPTEVSADQTNAMADGGGGTSPALRPAEGQLGQAEVTLQALDGAPLPPAPPVSQTPLPGTVESIHQMYSEIRALR